MIKIKHLNVKNFKSLIDTTVQVFGDVNMFYGYNNSGKSNIFRFLKLLFESKSVSETVNYQEDGAVGTKTDVLISKTNFWNGTIFNEPFLFTNNLRTTPVLFDVTVELSNDLLPAANSLAKEGFLGEDVSDLRLEGKITTVDVTTSKLRVEKAYLNGKQFLKVEDDIDVFFDGISDDELTKRIGESILMSVNDLVLFIDSDRNFIKETITDGVEIVDSRNLKNGLYELEMNAEKNEDFIKLKRFLSGFDFSAEAKEKLGRNIESFPFNSSTDIGFTRFDKEIEVMLRNRNGRLPLKNYGTGIQQFLYLLTKIYFSKSRVVILEEIELNLSPLYQKELLRFLKEMMPSFFDQLIFSSHAHYFTQRDSVMIDVIHHVLIDFVLQGGTSVDSHEDISETYDEATGHSYISFFYS